MKHYILYDQESGEIRVDGQCADFDYDFQARPNLVLMEGQGSYLTHFVQDGQIVAYTAEQASAKAARPAGLCHWSNDTFSWVDARTQQQIEAEAATLARAKRDELLAQSDWTDTLSAKTRLGDALYNAWQDYRQILRDVPQQAGFPNNIAWPEPPSPT